MNLIKTIIGAALAVSALNAQATIVSAESLQMPGAGTTMQAAVSDVAGQVTSYTPMQGLAFDGMSADMGSFPDGTLNISLELSEEEEGVEAESTGLVAASALSATGSFSLRDSNGATVLEGLFEVDFDMFVDITNHLVKIVAIQSITDNAAFGGKDAEIGIIVDFSMAIDPTTGLPYFPGSVPGPAGDGTYSVVATVFSLSAPPPNNVTESGTLALMLLGGFGLAIGGLRRRTRS